MSKDFSWAIAYLKEHLLEYEPEKLLNNIDNVKDVYEYRYTLKRIRSSNTVIAHIANLILDAIHMRRRFRTLDCLKVLRTLVKQLPVASELTEETHVMLFEIYKQFVLSGRENVQWCVSAIIKDRKLGDEAVDWLVSNHKRSTHIVNRLLLYPCSHPTIKSWAEQVLSEGGLLDRRSDLFALLIDKDLPKTLDNEDFDTIQWAIFKARIPHKSKINLLKKYSNLDSLNSTIKIADRLEAPEILYSLLEKLESAHAS